MKTNFIFSADILDSIVPIELGDLKLLYSASLLPVILILAVILLGVIGGVIYQKGAAKRAKALEHKQKKLLKEAPVDEAALLKKPKEEMSLKEIKQARKIKAEKRKELEGESPAEETAGKEPAKPLEKEDTPKEVFARSLLLKLKDKTFAPAEDDLAASLLETTAEKKELPEKIDTPQPEKPPEEIAPAAEAATEEPPKAIEEKLEKAPPAVETEPVAEVKTLKEGLQKTHEGFVAKLERAFSRKKIDATLKEEIEEALLTADIGPKTALSLLEKVNAQLSKKELDDPEIVWQFIREACTEVLTITSPPLELNRFKPFVIMVLGVNGTGKTTTIGKLACQFKKEGKTVMMAAGDTFRAAAVEQLEVWGTRTGIPVFKGKEGEDPSSVIFDAIKKGLADQIDIIIADTAGRLHTKVNLMEELKKVKRVMGKVCEGAPHEIFLVLDATTGQNAITQAKMFKETLDISGIIITKLDGTAKGGVILGISDELRIPIRYIGIGEHIEDLRPFKVDEFVDALF